MSFPLAVLARHAASRWSLAAVVSVAAAVAAPTAVAAPGSGNAKLTLGGSGKAARSLAAEEIRTSASWPARKRGRRVTLPVRSVRVGKAATVGLRGGIAFKAGKRSLRLKAFEAKLTASRATVTAKAGKRRVPVFVARLAKGRAKLDRSATTARLAGAKLALTPRGARLLRSKLAAGGVSSGAIGRLRLGARPADSGTPRSGELGQEPPLKARPATAVDVHDVSIDWYPRDSWVRYVSSGVGKRDGIHVGGGATKLPATLTSSHPCSDVAYSGSGSFEYGYRFTPRSGWYDPVSGAAAVYGSGSVRFVWASHQIDLAAANPEIELDGSSSRAVFAFTGQGDTAFTDQRADLLSLALADQPELSGNRRTYTAVRGRLTTNGQSVFAGFYPPPGDGFGCVTTSFTTP